MGVSKGMVGKKRWKFVAKKEKTAERKFWNRWKCKNILSFSNMAEYSQSRGNLNGCDGLFLLNEHGDLYFLLHKNIVHIILLNLEKKLKNMSEGKKDKKKDLSFLLFLFFFSKQCLVENFRESFKEIYRELFFVRNHLKFVDSDIIKLEACVTVYRKQHIRGKKPNR